MPSGGRELRKLESRWTEDLSGVSVPVALASRLCRVSASLNHDQHRAGGIRVVVLAAFAEDFATTDKDNAHASMFEEALIGHSINNFFRKNQLGETYSVL